MIAKIASINYHLLAALSNSYCEVVNPNLVIVKHEMEASHCIYILIMMFIMLVKSFVNIRLYTSHHTPMRLLSDNAVATSDHLLVPSGLLAVYKPQSWSSAAVVSKIKWILQTGQMNVTKVKTKIKVGHGGTLDPLAEGVLVLGIGKGTQLLSSYLNGTKRYEAIAELGKETDTLDSEGKVVEERDCSNISLLDLENALPKFRGPILQIPPMYSALKKDGQRLYDLARAGEVVERQPRNVTAYHLDLIRENVILPNFSLDLECSGGFYVRVLISDIARSCGGVAHMTKLVRTKQGQFTLPFCLHERDWEYEKIIQHIRYCSKDLVISNADSSLNTNS